MTLTGSEIHCFLIVIEIYQSDDQKLHFGHKNIVNEGKYNVSHTQAGMDLFYASFTMELI